MDLSFTPGFSPATRIASVSETVSTVSPARANRNTVLLFSLWPRVIGLKPGVNENPPYPISDTHSHIR